MKIFGLLTLACGILLSCGCDAPPSGTSTGNRASGSAPPPPPGAADSPGAQPAPEDEDASATEAPPEGQAEFVREQVQVGADRRGRNYGGGVITEPIRQYFRAGQQIQLLNLKRAMDLYKAGHDNKLPSTHEQFMEEIVKANGIELPLLPEGERYVFDPAEGELLVERPKP